MEVSSVSTKINTAAPQAKRAEQPKRPEPQQAKAQETQAPKKAENKPTPVVNTQGQTTGRIVNTSA